MVAFDSTYSLLRSLLARLGSVPVVNIPWHNFTVSRNSVIAFSVLFWIALVRIVRWRRYNAIHRKYKAKWDNICHAKGQGIMDANYITPEEAQEVIQLSAGYDMPLLLNYAVAFALFKTYGIPSISRLLCATKELSLDETISRRYADTENLVATWVFCPISGFVDPTFHEDNLPGPNQQPADDPRAMIALARVNYLHAKYNISNEDYLYTLALFTLEGNSWATRYGWRTLSPLERHAYYVFWAEIGRRMNIDSIPDSFESLNEWAKEYEREHMVPAQSNRDLAEKTLAELLSAVPSAFGLKGFAKKLAICLMDDVVRESMSYAKQPWALSTLVTCLLKSFHYFQRFFLLPRSSVRCPIRVDLPTPEEHIKQGCPVKPRLHPNKFLSYPWYRPIPTTLIGRLTETFLVKIGWYKEFPGPHLKSEGYRIEEMGPIKFENEGHEEVMRQAEILQGCPITGPWSLKGDSHS